jgi:hypothetical protein
MILAAFIIFLALIVALMFALVREMNDKANLQVRIDQLERRLEARSQYHMTFDGEGMFV